LEIAILEFEWFLWMAVTLAEYPLVCRV